MLIGYRTAKATYLIKLDLSDEDARSAALRQFGRWAADKRFDFSWYDAVICTNQLQGPDEAQA